MSPLHLRLGALAAVALLVVAPSVVSPFTVTLLNFIGIYALVAIGLALLTGIAGIVSFGQAAFVGIAAYATAWATAMNGWSPWAGLVLGLVVTCLFAWLLGVITLRLQGHFLSLSTIAWGLAIGFLFGNLSWLGQHNGIANVPPVSIGSLVLLQSWQMYYLIWAVVVVTLVLVYNLLNSRFGRALKALRGGNTLTESLGVNAFWIKVTCFVIAAFLSAVSGWLYAHLSRFVSPTPFEPLMGIEYLMMAMIGGAGSPIGGVIGAAAVTFLKNAVQDYLPQLFSSGAQQLEIVVFGGAFILFLQYARRGLTPFLLHYLPKLNLAPPAEAPALPVREKPQAGTPLLSVDKAERRFGGLIAVNKVSFDVKAGEIFGLIGPNGAGKSTMFNLLTGALHLDGGRIVFAGNDITRLPQHRIAQGGIARTFQHVKLRPRMTLLENVMLGSYPRTKAGLLKGLFRLNRAEEASARYDALRQLERVGLADKPYELAGNLPLGNQRVLEIARALSADPVLLVLDEPAAGLRRHEKIKLAELLRTLRDTYGLTILLVEHDMEFVMGVVDRIVVMDFGEKLCEGLPAEIRANPRVQEAYLGGTA